MVTSFIQAQCGRLHRRVHAVGSVISVFAAAMVALGWASAMAGVKTDNTLGHPAATLNGPNFLIPASLGQAHGGNLFQSFDQFNLATGESATFSGPGSINNVIARVTGGTSSSIDGTLSCTIPNANLYLINPAGVMFGPNAQLNITGSFAVTTAQVLRHSAGGTFDAQTPSSSVLSAAPPSAFGFTTAGAAPISVAGVLAVPTGKTISIIAGPVTVAGGTVSAPAGRINLVSAAGAGDVKVDPASTTSTLDASGISTFADMTLNAGAQVFADGAGGGRVVLRAGKLVLDSDAAVKARTLGGQNGAGVSITADTVSMTNGGFVSTGTRAGASGNAGPIDVTSNSVTLDGADDSSPPLRSGLFASTSGGATGNAGNVTIHTGALSVTNQAEIDVGTTTTGQGGNVSITATSVNVDAQGSDAFTGIFSQVRGPSGTAGNGGNISITTDSLTMNSNGVISTSVFSSGAGGSISINAKTVSVAGSASIAAETTTDFGNAGDINLTTTGLTLQGGGNISADTLGDPANSVFTFGNGGNVTISTSTALIDAQGAPAFTGVLSQSLGSFGAAGNIVFHADKLTIQNGGEISSESLNGGQGGNVDVTASSLSIDSKDASGFTGIRATTDFGSSPGGNVQVVADQLFITNASGEISADTSDAGNSGNVTVQSKSIDITAGGRLSANSSGAGNAGSMSVTSNKITLDGTGGILTGIRAEASSTGLPGQIAVNAQQMHVVHGAVIDSSSDGAGTSAAGATGGSVTINGGTLVVAGTNSQIGAASQGATPGGSIQINANSVAVNDSASITTQVSGTGGGGTIAINAQRVNVRNNVATIKAITSGPAKGGDIAVNARRVNIAGHSAIAASTTGTGDGGSVHLTGNALVVTSSSAVDSTSTQTGSAGRVSIDSNHVHVTRKSFLSSGATASGNGNTLTINAAANLTLDNNAAITSESVASSGGDIGITSKGPVSVSHSIIFSSAGVDAGSITIATPGSLDVFHSDISTQAGHNGGNISLRPGIASLNASFVTASAHNNGGNISIQPQALLISAHTPVTATGTLGESGHIDLTPPDQTIASSVARLPVSLYTTDLTLQPSCGQMTGMMNVSSFVISGRGGVPLGPDTWQVDFGVQNLAEPPASPATQPAGK
jgi:filamentous hemagglutinin family protein